MHLTGLNQDSAPKNHSSESQITDPYSIFDILFFSQSIWIRIHPSAVFDFRYIKIRIKKFPDDPKILNLMVMAEPIFIGNSRIIILAHNLPDLYTSSFRYRVTKGHHDSRRINGICKSWDQVMVSSSGSGFGLPACPGYSFPGFLRGGLKASRHVFGTAPRFTYGPSYCV